MRNLGHNTSQKVFYVRDRCFNNYVKPPVSHISFAKIGSVFVFENKAKSKY